MNKHTFFGEEAIHHDPQSERQEPHMATRWPTERLTGLTANSRPAKRSACCFREFSGMAVPGQHGKWATRWEHGDEM